MAGVRRARKLRALRLLMLGGPLDAGPSFADEAALAEARRAWREWGGLTPPLLDRPLIRR